MSKSKIDRLTESEIDREMESEFYEPGKPYLFIMGFGWAVVGFYIKHENPLFIQVAHANHFRNANKDYGKLTQEGAGNDCEWRYEGRDLLNVSAILRVANYNGMVPRKTTN